MATFGTITMSMREINRLKTIQAVVDGVLKPMLAARRLELTTRQVQRFATASMVAASALPVRSLAAFSVAPRTAPAARRPRGLAASCPVSGERRTVDRRHAGPVQ